MIVIPAVDLLGGKAVRLAKGERSSATTYSDNPLGLIDRFADAGAKRVHLVDLDGAFDGDSSQFEMLRKLSERSRERRVEVQVGGGIRDIERATALFDVGADYVVLGTVAIKEPELVRALCAQHAGRIIVAADARKGKVAVAGWQEETPTSVAALARAAEVWGASAVLHTDVERDGMQTGPAVEATIAIQKEVDIPIFASGGVGSLADIEACAAAGIRGVVVGRALYEGAFTLKEALSRC